MLIMQHMTNMSNVDNFEAYLTQAHREQEARALTILHSAGFVHGDLRDANVMVNESGRVCIIHFDWSGKEGTARYPSTMNKLLLRVPLCGLGVQITVRSVRLAVTRPLDRASNT